MADGGFDYKEFQQLAESVQQLEKHNRKFIENFLLQMAQRAMRDTKKRTPVDTGDLRNAWRITNVVRWGDEVKVTLVNPKHYASFVEFGHWQKPGRFIPGSFLGGKFEYIPGYPFGMTLSKSWVPGRFMATLSIKKIEREMPKRFRKAWENYVSGLLKV